MVRVPGFTHPVEDFYLENILQLTGYQEAAVQRVGGLTGGSGAGGGGGGGGGAGGKQPKVSAQERRQIEEAIEAAFTLGSCGYCLRGCVAAWFAVAPLALLHNAALPCGALPARKYLHCAALPPPAASAWGLLQTRRLRCWWR